LDRLSPGKGGGKDRKASLMPRIGPKIKHTRLLKGLTLRELADAAGCSESLLSKIENGRANPSLKMIHRVASALGTPVASLFQHCGIPTTSCCAAASGQWSRPIRFAAAKACNSKPLSPAPPAIFFPATSITSSPAAAATASFSTKVRNSATCLTVRSSSTSPVRRYRIGEGDSFHFRSQRAHSYRNVGKKKARILWLNTPPTF
jgi:transcriptional regulator with XRE-family HTH domain